MGYTRRSVIDDRDHVSPYRAGVAAGGLACPRGCHEHVLRACKLHMAEVQQCASCRGLWVRAKVFNDLLFDPEQQREAIDIDARLVADSPEPVDCPVCAQTMERQNFGRTSEVYVDSCKSHGVWFDAGELRAAAQHLVQRGEATLAPGDDPHDMERARLILATHGVASGAKPSFWLQLLTWWWR